MRLLVAMLILLASLASLAAADALDDEQWHAARSGAERLMRVPGQVNEKSAVIEDLAADDSERASRLLVKWALASEKYQRGDLQEEYEKTKAAFEKIERLLLKAYDKMPPTQAKHLKSWQTARNQFMAAQEARTAEFVVQTALASALEQVTDETAVAYLAGEGMRTARKAKRSAVAKLAIVKCLVRQPLGAAARTLLDWGADPKTPAVRVLVLGWIGDEEPAGGARIAIEALEARLIAVRRAAVGALSTMNEPHAVKPLIDCLQSADGQLAEEIDAALFTYTGQTFDGDGAIWMQWWGDHGEAWVKERDRERWDEEERKGGGSGASFYGIATKSNRIVFVLDRSGSMQRPANDGAKRPKGPVTGGNKGDEDAPVEGNTKMEVAKNQLARSIDGLPPQVLFNVVFYSSDVQVWKPPPDLIKPTPAAKSAAKAWFMELKANGSTQLFGGLMRALDYSGITPESGKKPVDGADTIFLLSDGTPTGADGKPLPADEVRKAYEAFLDANRIHRCVVHTIGIGPGHNRWLMEQIARESGGTYRGVGDK